MVDPAVTDELVPLLGKVSLFSRCNDYELRIVARKAELREFSTGDHIITKGEDTSELFIVLRGSVQAVLDGNPRHVFSAGDFFGELAALVPAPRSTDVIALEDTLVAALTRNEVYLLLDAIPGVARKMIEGLAESIREMIGNG